MDKIGDLVLSLNADQWQPLHSQNNHWWVSQGTEFIPELAVPQRSWTSFSKIFSLKGFISCLQWLKNHRPERAFVFHAPWWVGAALFVARVPYRVGRLSQWHSFIFFNYGVRQSRSNADRHESQYNIDLLKAGLEKIEGKTNSYPTELPPPLILKAPLLEPNFLDRWGLKNKSYVVVHPGMAGSALNWPGSYYAEVIHSLSSHSQIVVTGTAMDREYIESLKSHLNSTVQIHWLNEKLSIKELLGVLNSSLALLAPSTGVLHLGASLGIPCFGIYSPRRVEKALRWGPRGNQVQVFEPLNIYADASLEKAVEGMKSIHPKQVSEAILQILKGSTNL